MSKAWRTSTTASARFFPVPSPSRLKPPQPRPATETLSPVRPSVAYSMIASAMPRRVEPDADEVAKKLPQPAAVRLRQGRRQQRSDVGAQMLGVAGAEKDHVDPR